jgi:hypothetical protein
VSSRQETHENKFKNLAEFCHLAEQQLLTGENFYQNVHLTYKATFLNQGEVIAGNVLCRDARNPLWPRKVEHQRQLSVKVCCGVIGNRVTAPYSIVWDLNG